MRKGRDVRDKYVGSLSMILRAGACGVVVGCVVAIAEEKGRGGGNVQSFEARIDEGGAGRLTAVLNASRKKAQAHSPTPQPQSHTRFSASNTNTASSSAT